MGWIISIILIIAGAVSGVSNLMVAAGIFAIAGERRARFYRRFF